MKFNLEYPKIIIRFLQTVFIITFLHEFGHLLGHYLRGDFNAHLVIIHGRGLLPFVPAIAGGLYHNIFNLLIIPLFLQFSYLLFFKKSKKRPHNYFWYFWIIYIFWGHRFDFIFWISIGFPIF